LSSAQILPNPGFEIWEPFSGYEDPQSWHTPNQYTSLIGVQVVTKSTDAYSGDYSAKLETKNVLTFKAPGLLTLSDFTVDIITQTYSFDGGIPLTETVNKMTGMYKYSGANGDSASAMIISFRYNEESQQTDTVGLGYGFLHDAADWTAFTVNMYPWSEAQPDSFNVIIMSSGSFDLNVGSVLYVDELSLETITGVYSLFDETTQVKMYPNPVSDIAKFEVDSETESFELTLFEITGKQIDKLNFSGKTAEVNLANFPAGIYLYKITSKNKILGNGSFVKK
jgi:virulence-associated protein VapD